MGTIVNIKIWIAKHMVKLSPVMDMNNMFEIKKKLLDI